MSCLYCSIFPIYGEDVCLKKSACVCEFSNGTGIDLSSASKSTFFSAQTFEVAPATNAIELSTYYYHPCYDILLKPNSTTVNNTCTVPTAVSYNFKKINFKRNIFHVLNKRHYLCY